MAKKKPVFTYDVCLACAICIPSCPVSAITLQLTGIDAQGNVYPELNGRNCIGCGLCAKACPMGAIAMKETAPDAGETQP